MAAGLCVYHLLLSEMVFPPQNPSFGRSMSPPTPPYRLGIRTLGAFPPLDAQPVAQVVRQAANLPETGRRYHCLFNTLLCTLLL